MPRKSNNNNKIIPSFNRTSCSNVKDEFYNISQSSSDSYSGTLVYSLNLFYDFGGRGLHLCFGAEDGYAPVYFQVWSM